MAIVNGFQNTIPILLKYGGDIKVANKAGEPPIYLVFKNNGNINLWRFLLNEPGLTEGFKTKGPKEETVLHALAHNLFCRTSSSFILEGKLALVNDIIARGIDISFVSDIIAKGVDPKAKDKTGKTFLDYCPQLVKEKMIEKLNIETII